MLAAGKLSVNLEMQADAQRRATLGNYEMNETASELGASWIGGMGGRNIESEHIAEVWCGRVRIYERTENVTLKRTQEPLERNFRGKRVARRPSTARLRRQKPLKTSLLLQLKRNQRKKQPRSPQRRLQKLRPQPKNRQQLNRTIGIILMMTQLLKL